MMKRYEHYCAFVPGGGLSDPVERPNGDWVLYEDAQAEIKRLQIEARTFKRGDRVRKKTGSHWQGLVVGEYSTTLTPEGYAVESDAHPGSVQIYPVHALEIAE